MPARSPNAAVHLLIPDAWGKVRRLVWSGWEAISTISELVGAVVVVVTLCYVAVQIRQNTNALLANSRQTLLDADLGLISEFITHAVHIEIFPDEAQLTPEDERRMMWLLIKAIRIREFAWHQYKSGNLDEKSWESYMAPVAGLFATKRAKAVLNLYTGSPEFLQVLNDRLTAAKEKAA